MAAAAKRHPTPVFLFSHGTTMMLGEESEPAEFWRSVGDEALRRGIRSIIMMGAHWECTGDKIQVAMNPNPQKTPVAYVAPRRYANFELTPDIPLANRVIGMLRKAGFDAEPNPTFNFIHDTFLILIRMFPTEKTNIPAVIVSANARFDPYYHIKVGSTLRPLRYENVLIIGSGGTVHNLYRNHWMQMVLHRDNFAQPTPPGQFALEFRQAMEDAFTMNCGPMLRRVVARLMKHPMYRDAHGTDDHFISAAFVAGAAGDQEDADAPNAFRAECWELVNMANTQFQLGLWEPAERR
ncbi:Extradiol ring-cleavage dioxygenase, class III enzyme, subunit B [Aspergillus pseudoustus]|uniref:Extradiol ring-cleavage dioxygenase, class III enzyme, subunit B n=1 Tax=Aspergillus pseudoustus TaxID=1810923 RepID=A0ABR4IPG4_9EURO